MCGIIRIVEKSVVQDQMLYGLLRPEYLGYGSTGVAIMSNAKASVSKAVGRLEVRRLKSN